MNEKVNMYLGNLPSSQREKSQELRELILNTFPKISEKMKYGVPYFDKKFYIVGLKDSVNLGFSIKNLSDEETSLFQGTGKTTRHLKFHTSEEIDKEKILRLLKLDHQKSS